MTAVYVPLEQSCLYLLTMSGNRPETVHCTCAPDDFRTVSGHCHFEVRKSSGRTSRCGRLPDMNRGPTAQLEVRPPA